MRKTLTICLIFLMSCSLAFAAVGYQDEGTPSGAVTTLNVHGGVKTFDGSTLTVSIIGVATGGVSTMVSATLAVPVGYSVVTKNDISGMPLTLANGVEGQVLTILIGSGSINTVLTPTTKTGFSTVTFDAAKDSVTLLYINDTAGWIVIGQNSVTIA